MAHFLKKKLILSDLEFIEAVDENLQTTPTTKIVFSLTKWNNASGTPCHSKMAFSNNSIENDGKEDNCIALNGDQSDRGCHKQIKANHDYAMLI